ncbi:IS4 family transposase [Undibacterium luofuense]|uniref:IS4 family transposase n=1 Tax=Undibacterium luofuense TaxID=2828733 RepID=A0A941DN93_9BURK|nr:IS4 family transposase [Undibacterium luofuense]MBR7781866.1 IS4 family transposase [Undibacterium luofuense]
MSCHIEVFRNFAEHLQSDLFRETARHSEYPTAFTRKGGKLPLPSLIAVMVSGMRMSVRAELDQFFAHLRQQAQLVHHVSEQAFAQARAKLSGAAIPKLNDWFIQQVDAAGLVPRWRGLRLVAADASNLRFGLRASHVPRAATTEQNAFALFLPGVEMTLAATLYDVSVGERQMLFEHLEKLSVDDILLLDRGYQARWLVAALNQAGVHFCMRVDRADKGGFNCVRDFIRSGNDEAVVRLGAPNQKDVTDYGCPSTGQEVRLVRIVTSDGAIRVLMTNLLDARAFPCVEFGELYHHRWRIEEAFKRLKHRLSLEHVSGLSQLAVMQDFAAKILCDNLQALACLAAISDEPLPEGRRINHSYAHTVLKRILPVLLLTSSASLILKEALLLITSHTYRHQEGQSKPRKSSHKPHKYMSHKAC